MSSLNLQKLSINRFRNLCQVDLSLRPGVNVLYGANGAGKTSVLEAIYFLSHSRSFKTRNARHLIKNDEQKFRITGMISEKGYQRRIGVEKSHDGYLGKINGIKVRRPSEMADILPTLVIHPETFSLLTGDPGEKRAFLDWGIFYAEGDFRRHWQNYQQALKQRNAALRTSRQRTLITCWDTVLADSGEAISLLREKYLNSLVEKLPGLLRTFSEDIDLELRYRRGWPSGVSLLDQLQGSLESDLTRGFTQSGPQRGGFKTYFNGYETTRVASRGQLKLVTIILKLAQAQVFLDGNERSCLLLLDDLDAELDRKNFERFLAIVEELGLQTVWTTLDKDKFSRTGDTSACLFHVEHGSIQQML
jgi:DNA replication and repair protein RecF